mgnify:CR=1 FL=1
MSVAKLVMGLHPVIWRGLRVARPTGKKIRQEDLRFASMSAQVYLGQ